jgi:hypothetical protein
MKSRYVYTIQPQDVGKPWIKINGRARMVSDFIGSILERDIGKRIYEIEDVLQVENDEQMARRLP